MTSFWCFIIEFEQVNVGRSMFLRTLSIFILMGAKVTTQSVFTCSKLTVETLEQGVKYVQS